ncbi:hypothetical protein A2U01_0065164, partial [Trifolium medium]|nr:hypothetical protein [Trifolium medium]
MLMVKEGQANKNLLKDNKSNKIGELGRENKRESSWERREEESLRNCRAK